MCQLPEDATAGALFLLVPSAFSVRLLPTSSRRLLFAVRSMGRTTLTRSYHAATRLMAYPPPHSQGSFHGQVPPQGSYHGMPSQPGSFAAPPGQPYYQHPPPHGYPQQPYGAPPGVPYAQPPVQSVPAPLFPPYNYPSCNPPDDAHSLKKAIVGLGTDEKTLIRIIANRNKQQMAAIASAYKNKAKEPLIKAIKGDTSGNFKYLLYGRVRSNIEVKVKALRAATKGAGTDERLLIDVLAFSTNAEIAEIKRHYKDLEKHLKGDTSGDFWKAIKDLLKGDRNESPYVDDTLAQNDAENLYRAGEKRLGTDESVFIKILCNRSPWHNARINHFYQMKYKHDLIKAIKKETSGNFCRLLKALCTLPYDYWAKRVYHSMKGAGTDDNGLVYVFSILDKGEIHYVAKLIKQKFDKDMSKMIKGDTSGWYQKLLLELAK